MNTRRELTVFMQGFHYQRRTGFDTQAKNWQGPEGKEILKFYSCGDAFYCSVSTTKKDNFSRQLNHDLIPISMVPHYVVLINLIVHNRIDKLLHFDFK